MRTSSTRRPFSRALIEESDLAMSLHLLLQNQGLLPGIVMGIRTQNEPVTEGERAFIIASTKKAYLEGDTPIHLKHFSKDKEKEGT